MSVECVRNASGEPPVLTIPRLSHIAEKLGRTMRLDPAQFSLVPEERVEELRLAEQRPEGGVFQVWIFRDPTDMPPALQKKRYVTRWLAWQFPGEPERYLAARTHPILPEHIVVREVIHRFHAYARFAQGKYRKQPSEFYSKAL